MLLPAAVVLFVASCSTPKDVTYFQDITEAVVPVDGEGTIKIEPGDRISIIVKSKDPALSELYNLTVNTNRVGMAALTIPKPPPASPSPTLLWGHSHISEVSVPTMP